ncbi:hypothetical protein SSX86_009859 [Deinandra increscens subsp. villosa]|uniref:RRM domain-containing protein n=1 Tax=Deinandra increscens subsp. villosa TaxID=3103831 RepID=A0AAP0D9Z1_9ASTR
MVTRSFRQQRSRFFHNRGQGFFNGFRFPHGDFDDEGVFHEFEKEKGFAWEDDGRFEHGEEKFGNDVEAGNPWHKVVNRKDKYKHANPQVSSSSFVPKSFSKSWEEVDKWSTTVYVTNLPPLATIKGIRDQCMKAGNVVDVFVPVKAASTGKKYAFVRFSKGSDISDIIYKIRNIWIGNFRLYADVARFKRGSQAKKEVPKVVGIIDGAVKEKFGVIKGVKVWKKIDGDGKVTDGVKDNSLGSEATNGKDKAHVGSSSIRGAAEKGEDQKELGHDSKFDFPKSKGNEVSVVKINNVHEDCLITGEEFSGSLCLRVKNIANMRHLHQFAFNEGFEDISFQYLGGLWVRVDCGSKAECVKFSKCEGLKPLFHSCIKPKSDFIIDERVVWVEIRGLPFCAWNNVVFSHVANYWGNVCLVWRN